MLFWPHSEEEEEEERGMGEGEGEREGGEQRVMGGGRDGGKIRKRKK